MLTSNIRDKEQRKFHSFNTFLINKSTPNQADGISYPTELYSKIIFQMKALLLIDFIPEHFQGLKIFWNKI